MTEDVLLHERAEIEELLHSLHLTYDQETLPQQMARAKQHRIVLVVQNDKNEKCIFRCLVRDLPGKRECFLREIAILEALAAENLVLPFRINRIIGHTKEPFLWLLTDYLEGHECGNVFEFDSIHLTGKFASFLADSIRTISTVKISGIAESGVNETHQYIEKVLGKLKSNLAAEPYLSIINRRYDGCQSLLAASSNYVFSHGDLLPLNFIQTDTGYAIIDWETAGFRPRSYDLAYLLHRGWRYPDWQSRLMKHLPKYLTEVEMRNLSFWKIIFLVLDIVTIARLRTEEISLKHNQLFSESYLAELEANYRGVLSGLLSQVK